jgi:hypothetical protein
MQSRWLPCVMTHYEFNINVTAISCETLEVEDKHTIIRRVKGNGAPWEKQWVMFVKFNNTGEHVETE